MNKRKAVSNVDALTTSDCGDDEAKATSAKPKVPAIFSAVSINSDKTTSGKAAAVHSKSLGGIVEGTEVKDINTASVLAQEFNKGRTLDDVKFLMSLMESAQHE